MPTNRYPALLALLAALAAGTARADALVEGAPTVETAPITGTETDRAEAERAEAGARNPSATDIIRGLAPFADGNPGAPLLTVRPDDGGPRVRVDTARAVDLTVFFAYDSARLTPEARIQLEPLGRALQAPELARHGFLIAGHTDAAGAAGYNRRLSLARARAVRAHLVEAYGIDPARLRVHGWGAARLKAPGAPLDRVNRRVEVGLIAPAAAGLGDGPDLACSRFDDPRRRVALDLDDFGAAPTPVPCPDRSY